MFFEEEVNLAFVYQAARLVNQCFFLNIETYNEINQIRFLLFEMYPRNYRYITVHFDKIPFKTEVEQLRSNPDLES